MKKALNDLWHGNIAPIEEDKKQDPREREFLSRIVKIEHVLTQNMSKEEKALLNEYSDQHHELAGVLAERAFAQGFSLATKLLLEALWE